ncbi:MAG: SdrD B-like domain-containing protein [Chitinophagales bacterium]
MSRMRNMISCLFVLAISLTSTSMLFGQADLQFNAVDAFSEPALQGEYLNLSFEVTNVGSDFQPGGTPTVDVYFDNDGSGTLTPGDNLIVKEDLGSVILNGQTIQFSNQYILPISVKTCPLLLSIESVDGPFNYGISSVPYLNAGKDVVLCDNETGELGLGDGVNGYTYLWTAIGGADINALSDVAIANPTISAVNFTDQQIEWQFVLNTDKGAGSNCDFNDTVTVFICPTKIETVCSGDDFSFNVSATGYDNIVWTGPNGFTSDQATPLLQNVQFSDTGVYKAVTYFDGCVQAKGCFRLRMNETPSTPQPSANVPYCIGSNDTLKLFANATADEYQWSGPNQFTSSEQNPTIVGLNVLNAGTYQLVLVNNGCSSDPGLVNVSFGNCTVDVEKLTNGQDADNAPGPIILVDLDGEIVTWSYVVTNNGSVDLTNVTVTDNKEGVVGTIPFLAAGASQTLTLTGDAVRMMYSNLATVVGQPVDNNGNPVGPTVTDSDPSHYTGVFINVEKIADKDTICPGEEVTYNLIVRMLGGAPGVQIRDISIVDNNLVDTLDINSPFFVGTDVNGNGFIDFADADSNGKNDEEFLFEYGLFLTEDNINIARDRGEVWYVDPISGAEFFVGVVGNRDTVSVAVLVDSSRCKDIGDFVWYDINRDGIQDASEPGVEGVTVYLLDDLADTIGTTTTDANGFYLFPGIRRGTYQIIFDISTNTQGLPYALTDKDQGGNDELDSDANPNGSTDLFQHRPSILGDKLDLDAGLYLVSDIGDFVWNDTDGDGIQDAGETGIEGVTVYLIDANGDTVQTDVTDANGAYLFEDVNGGDYIIAFDPTSNVDGQQYTGSPQGQGGDNTVDSDPNANGIVAITFDPTQGDNLDVDAGFVPTGSIGDFVFEDSDNDGIQDPGENGVQGVIVYLIDNTTGDTVATDTTDFNGEYLFEDVPAGEYVLGVDPNSIGDSEFADANQGGDDELDSDINPLTGLSDPINFDPTNGDDLSVDVGLTPTSDLGDFVWSDTNGDGIQDAGEPGIEGVTVYLIDVATGDTVGTDVTDAAGAYLFTSVTTGDYIVSFDVTTYTNGQDYTASPQNQGGDNNLDSDPNPTTGTVAVTFDASNGDDLSIDAGYIPTGSIGDLVFQDLNGDGIQDGGESGVEGVVVYLIDNVTGDTLATDTTDANGEYLFEGVQPGEYIVAFDPNTIGDTEFSTANQGVNDELDSDANPNGASDPFTFDPTNGDDLSVDAGLTPIADIGDFVWNDTDGDGIQDAGETGIEGVIVYLIDANTGDTLNTDVTDNNGAYLFEDVTPGDYVIAFDPSNNTNGLDLTASPQDQGGSDATDSDINSNNTTAPFTFDPSQGDNLDVDAGFICTPDRITIDATTCIAGEEGTTVDTFTSAAGCDSIVTTITTLLPAATSTVDATTCDPQQVGTTVDTIVGGAANGCDSIVTTVTTLVPEVINTVNLTTCIAGEEGTSVDTFTSAAGCDSIVTTITNLLPTATSTVDATTCDPQQVGTTVDTIAGGAANGCDSIVTTVTTLVPEVTNTVNLTTCIAGEEGTSVDTFTSAAGCDSIVTTITTLLPTATSTVDATTCDPQQVGTTVDTIVGGAANGCDSIVTTVTTLLPTYEVTVIDTVCNPADSGIVVEVLSTIGGCDSIVTSINVLVPGYIELPDTVTVQCTDPIAETGEYCIPIPLADFINGYDLLIDGEVYFDLPFICDLDSIGGYDFTTVINSNPPTYGGGSYILLSWKINGVEKVTTNFTYNTFDELAAFMLSKDPNGQWFADGDRIEGGFPYTSSIYGTLNVFSPLIGAQSFTNYNSGVVSKGTLIQDIPVGCHWLTIVNLEYPACTDSIYVCVECPQIVTDTIIVTPSLQQQDDSIVTTITTFTNSHFNSSMPT